MHKLWMLAAAIIALQPQAVGAASRNYDFSAIDAELQRQCRSGEFAGVVLVRAGGEDLYQHACGEADPVNRIDNQRSMRFKIFSTSKFISALTIMKLVELRVLQLDNPIGDYLPDAPEAWWPVTIRQLLNHTSGISDHTELLFSHFRSDHPAAMRATLASLTPDQEELKSRPGDQFEYSNFGFELLAEIAARRTGDSFAALVHRHVFEPAGMKNARVEAPNILLGHLMGVAEQGLAIGYNGAPGKLEHATNFAFIQLGAGAVHATVDDFAALDQALNDGRIISAKSYAMMKENPVLGTGGLADRSFGLGIVLSRISGVAREGHTGGTNGYISDFQRFPDDGAMLIALSNRGFAKTKWLRDGVTEVLRAAR